MENRMDIEKAASVIMKTLPVCKERRISYATFTIIDISPDQTVNVVEYDNPSLLYFSQKKFEQIDRKEVRIGYRKKNPAKMYISKIEPHLGDRLIFHSDGLNQSGMGKRATPLGWGISGVKNCISSLVQNEPIISARSMAKQLVGQAIENDGRRSGDDTTCSVIYFRNPRALLIATGPPVDSSNDLDLATAFGSFNGTKVICGGTTAKIIARELSKKVLVDLRQLHPDVPPLSIMEGVDLVTEGIITLSRSLEYLEAPQLPTFARTNAALQLANMLLDNDEINFIVGTKLNDANQMISNKAIEIRHSIVRKLATVLENRYLKKITVRFL
jgi:hypothetical protein